MDLKNPVVQLEAIAEVWPQATVQLCVVHLVRASLRYASKAHWSPITKAVPTVCTDATAEEVTGGRREQTVPPDSGKRPPSSPGSAVRHQAELAFQESGRLQPGRKPSAPLIETPLGGR